MLYFYPFSKSSECDHKWSILSEAVRFLDCMSPTRKKIVMKEQVECMKDRRVGENLYSPETIIPAFEYLSISRSLYDHLREDYQLPSMRTLMKLTSKASKFGDFCIKYRYFLVLKKGSAFAFCCLMRFT